MNGNKKWILLPVFAGLVLLLVLFSCMKREEKENETQETAFTEVISEEPSSEERNTDVQSFEEQRETEENEFVEQEETEEERASAASSPEEDIAVDPENQGIELPPASLEESSETDSRPQNITEQDEETENSSEQGEQEASDSHGIELPVVSLDE